MTTPTTTATIAMPIPIPIIMREFMSMPLRKESLGQFQIPSYSESHSHIFESELPLHISICRHRQHAGGHGVYSREKEILAASCGYECRDPRQAFATRNTARDRKEAGGIMVGRHPGSRLPGREIGTPSVEVWCSQPAGRSRPIGARHQVRETDRLYRFAGASSD